MLIFQKLKEVVFNQKSSWVGGRGGWLIHKENPARCNSVSKLYFIFIWSTTCFRRHTDHHQEPKTALAATGLACVEGCWTCSCWTLSSNYTSNNPPRFYAKPEAAIAVLGSWWWALCRPKHVELHINMK